jgi:hypothetical protein
MLKENKDYFIEKPIINDSLSLEISKTISLTFPQVSISFFLSSVYLSVYAVYFTIFFGIKTVFHIFTSGNSAFYGKQYLELDQNNFIKAFYNRNFLFFVLLNSFIFTSILLIIPFINLYLIDVPNLIFYADFLISTLFLVWVNFFIFRIPFHDLIVGLGLFKKVNFINLVSIFFTISSSLILTWLFGISGAFFSMLFSSLVYLVMIFYTINNFFKKVFNSMIYFFIINLINIIIAVFIYMSLRVPIHNIFVWSFYGFVFFSISFISNYVFFKLLIKFKILVY